jgi:hypothetical protein
LATTHRQDVELAVAIHVGELDVRAASADERRCEGVALANHHPDAAVGEVRRHEVVETVAIEIAGSHRGRMPAKIEDGAGERLRSCVGGRCHQRHESQGHNWA